MKELSILLISIGIGIGVFAFNLDTTVKVDYSGYESNGLPERVNNIGLMSEKQNYLILAAVFFVSGVIAYGFGINSDSRRRVYNEPNQNIDDEDGKVLFCSNCGKPYELNDKFCSDCGSKL